MGTNTTMTATLKILADVSSAQGSVNKLASAFQKIKFSDSLKSEMTAAFSKFDKQVEEFKTKLQQPIETKGQANTLNKGAQEIKKSYDDILKYIKSAEKELTAEGVDLSKIFKIDSSTQSKIKQLEDQIQQVKQAFQDLGGANLVNATDTNFSDLNAKIKDTGQNILTIKQAAENAKNTLQTLGNGKFTLSTKVDEAIGKFTSLESVINSITTSSKSNQEMRLGILEALSNGDLETAQTKLQELYNIYERLASRSGQSENWQNNIIAVGTALEQVTSMLNAMNNATSGLETQKFQTMNGAVSEMGTAFQTATAGARNAQGAIDGVVSGTRSMADAQLEYNSSMEQMKSRIQYFFSINNAVQLLQRTLRSAFNTVKELDAAMTETATVTDFSVGDMWDQLPKYTAAANELGTTTLGAYETMTLFYQQGLDTNEVFQIGTETMKMARIAGLEYEDATNKMTAALRGFNMELNETSAQRVNDVYSELAAITAADTNEIATAMTKTASIADSANMEFETTSAFLSQIIETTRESAETAGTAMKTIVARFQELKKDPSEIELVDGESVDANKIETALRSVGVALRDTEGQFRDLDDVFLELASKWDSLDLNTQRYIATMAAGSRQQSRFIAMMQDYDRTMELVNAAYDSNGSSQKQFEKTTESLESKLNELKNAWDEFTMGIANSSLIKGGVDLLTQIITIFNKITQSGNSLWSMVKKLTAAFAGFKTAKVLLNGLLSGFTSLKSGVGILDGLFGGIKKSATKEFGGFATILKRTFSSNRIKWSDFINLDDSFSKEVETTYSQTLNNLKTKLQAAKIEYQQTPDMDLTVQASENIHSLEQQITALDKNSLAIESLGLNTQQYSKIRASDFTLQEQAIILSDKELATKAAETLALDGEAKAEAKATLQKEIANKQDQLGIGFGLKATLVKIGEGKASLFAAAAQKSKNAAMLAGLGTMLIYIAAAAALAAGIYLIADAIETDAEKQKRLNEVIEQNQAAYSNLESEVSEVKDSMEELGTLETELDDLAVGTDEWRAKLAEVNQEVLSLIEKFPRLAAALEIGEHGQLGFDNEALESYYTSVADFQSDIQSSSLLANYELQKMSQDSLYSNFVSELTNSLGPGLANMFPHDLLKMYDNAVAVLNISNGDIGAALEAAKKSSIRLNFNEDGTAIYSTFENWLSGQGVLETFENTLASFLTDSSSIYKETTGSLEAYIASVLDEDVLLGDYSDAIVTLTANRRSADAQPLYEANDFKIGHGNMSGHGTIFDNALDRLENYVIEEFGLTGDDLTTLYGSTTTRGGKKNLLRQSIATKENESLINEYGEEVSAYFDWLNQQDETVASDLASLITGNVDNLSQDFTSQIMEAANNGEKIDLSQLADYFGFSDVEAMAGTFGMNVEQLGTTFGSAISQAVMNQRKTYTDITRRVVKSGDLSADKLQEAYYNNFKTFDEISAKYADFFDFSSLIANVESNLANSGSDELTNIGVQQFWDAADSGEYSAQELQDFESYIASIDWSNPIEGAEALGDAINSDNALIQKFAQSTSETGEQIYSASAQMQYFIKSSDFEGVQEELEDILDTQGEISAQDVKKLASSYESLDRMLDNGVASAEGLAKALTLIQKGSISFTDLTNNVMTAIGSMSSLEQMSAETLETLSNFDPGIDENEVGDFMGTAYETISENLANGAVGNSQNFEYLDFLFPGWDNGLNLEAVNGDWDKLENETYKRLKFYEGILKQNSEDLGMSWAGLADGLQLNGKAVTEEGKQALKDANLAVTHLADGGVALTAEDGGAITATTEEVVAALAEAYGVSEQYAQMMLTDFSNYSAGLALELQGNDYTKGIQKVAEGLESATEQIGEDSISEFWHIDQRELETIGKLYGKTAEEILADIQETHGGKIKVTDWFDTETGALKTGVSFEEEFTEFYSGADSQLKESLAEKQEQLKQAQIDLINAQKAGDFAAIEDAERRIQRLSSEVEAVQQQIDAAAQYAYKQVSQVLETDESGNVTRVGVNYSQLIEEGLEQGFTEAEAAQYADQVVALLQSQFEGAEVAVTYTLEDGTESEPYILQEGQTVTQGKTTVINEDEATRQGQAMANALKEYFQDIPITFTAEGENSPTFLYGEVANEMQQASLESPVQLTYELTSNGETAEGAEDSTVITTQKITIVPSQESLDATTQIIGDAIIGAGPYPSDVILAEAAQAQLTTDVTEAVPDSQIIYVEADLTQAWKSLRLFQASARSTTVTVGNNSIGGTKAAAGIHDSSTSHTALIGEAGPEIHQTSDGWYLAETPQLAQIEKGDTVYNASETKDILNGGAKTKVRPRYASAYRSKWGYGGKASKTSTGSTSGTTSATSAVADAEEAAEIWENTFDWLYNLTEDINEILRDREKLEREYDRILAKRNTTAKDLWDNVQDQLAVLETERSKQQEMYDKRKWEMEDYISKNSDLQKYAWYNWDDMTIEIDWDRIDAVTDEDTGEAIEEYVSKLEDIQDKMDDAEDELMDIEDRIEELLEQGKDEYLDFENMVFEALQAQKQALIDNASEISEAIANTNSNLLDALSDSISKMREDRELEEDRTSLEDQQKKLIYLQQDTSGGNALEILKLQQEMEDAQQSYTDKLIDRKIDELQQQNDEASEQRERQIELAQEQLDHWSESQDKWNEIHALMGNGINSVGQIISDSELMEVLQNKEGVESLSSYSQMDWLKTLESDVKAGLTWFAQDQQLEKIGKTSGTIKFFDSSGTEQTGTVNSDGSVTVRDDKNGGNWTYSQVFRNYDGTYRTFEENASFKKDPEPEPPKTVVENNTPKEKEITIGGKINAGSAYIYGNSSGGGRGYQYFRSDPIYTVLKEQNGYLLTRWHGLSSGYTGWFKKSDVKAYKTGGLADYTGPAWLDGTPSKPEIVLNAQDTKNFIELKNVLASLMTNVHGADPSTNSMGNGDNYYDIDISVESISSDYDVEQVASKIKGMIVQDGLYRNVNSINRLK